MRLPAAPAMINTMDTRRKRFLDGSFMTTIRNTTSATQVIAMNTGIAHGSSPAMPKDIPVLRLSVAGLRSISISK